MTRTHDGTIHVFTYKEGLLSTIAHDLRLSLLRFEVQVDEGRVTCRFWPDSLQVDGAMRDGRLDANGLRDKDRREIARNIQKKILHTTRHPTGSFDGRLSGTSVSGSLTLHGQTQAIEFSMAATDGRYRGRVSLTPTRFGISPFKALMGAIKLKDQVDIVIDLPMDLAQDLALEPK